MNVSEPPVDATEPLKAEAAVSLARPAIRLVPPPPPEEGDDDLGGPPDGPDEDPRPEVILGVDLHAIVNDTIAAWMPRDVNVYTRSGTLVTVVDTATPIVRDDADGAPRPILTPKTPRVHPLPLAGISNRLQGSIRFLKKVPKRGLVRCMPTPRLIAELAARGEWQGASELVGITETPFLRPDGSVCQTPGYDSATGYLYVPNIVFPPVPSEPTRAEAVEALDALRDPFVDFPFASAAQSVVPVAAVLTVVARPAIRGSIPCIAIDAATRGSGKTKIADSIATITTGRSASRATFPEDDIELEKVLSSYALSGARLVLLDNVTRRFGGGPLDKVLTAVDDVDLRILGRSEMVRVRWTAQLLCSGNNIAFGDDTLRRTLMCRLESEHENPENRTNFAHDPLLEYLEERRARLVVAALTVLRAWTSKKLEASTGPWGSFDAWARLIPPAIVFAGGPNVLEARPPPERAGDDMLAALAIVLRRLPVLSPDAMSARRLIDALYPAPGAHDPPDGWADLRDAFEALGALSRGHSTPTPRGLTGSLSRTIGRVVDGQRLRSVVNRDGVRVFAVESARASATPVST